MKDVESMQIKVNCDRSELDEAEKKVEHLVELLKEASTLVDELASKEVTIQLKVGV